ncbi:hypothetical protein CES86_4046 [Brucella lupini]|uniref:Uncharacterized protein n=1 Tax=Brucella lupini TaxID=255457 RepID=A0A256GFU9_9HYPH|nr:hypothetical protein CES86_4046 [Brucella lupini]
MFEARLFTRFAEVLRKPMIDFFKRTYPVKTRTPKDWLIDFRIIGFFQGMLV